MNLQKAGVKLEKENSPPRGAFSGRPCCAGVQKIGSDNAARERRGGKKETSAGAVRNDTRINVWVLAEEPERQHQKRQQRLHGLREAVGVV
jgi:hypothetical protein